MTFSSKYMDKNNFKKNAQRALRYLWKSYRQFWKSWLVALITKVLGMILHVVPPLFYREIFDTITQVGGVKEELLAHAIGILFILFWVQLVNFVAYRVYDYFVISFEMNIQEWLNNAFLHKLQRHSFQFFTDNFTWSLITKVRKGVSAFETMTDLLSWQVLPFFINISFILIVIAKESVLLALWLLVLVIAFSFVQYKLYVFIYPYQEKANALDTEQGGLLSDILTNNFTIKFFAAEAKEDESYAKLNHKAAYARKIQYFKSIWIWGAASLFALFMQIWIMYVALQMWWKGAITIGMIVLLQTYVLKIIDFLWWVGQTLRQIFRGITEIGEVVEIVETPHEIQDKSDKKLKVKQGEIRFEEVDFSYGEHQIFQDLNLHIKPGQRVALVGESGSGKTTITKLLFRFYDLQKGNILIDDQEISEVTQASLRGAMSMIPQDPILFHRSIKENIAYGKPNASDEEIVAAAKMARCHEFISHLKEGYETLVGERGVKLSGGERQRVAIARAILENKQIIVMDEATSALDSESEFLIQEAMEELMKHKTVLIIAHRLSTIMKMDEIIVMDEGKVVEKGSHKELLAKSAGIYKKLRDIQSGGFIGQ